LIHSALIVENDKIKFVNGLLPTLDLLPVFVEKYKDDIAPDCIAWFCRKVFQFER